jgi:hypothetical protein
MGKGGARKGAGRPRTLETADGQAKVDRLLNALRGGNWREVACEWADIPVSTFCDWMREGEAGKPESSVDFRKRVLEAEKAAEIRAVALVMKAAEDDPRHAEWWLERKHPDRWGRKERQDVTMRGPGPGGEHVVEHRGEALDELIGRLDSLAARRREAGGPARPDE